MHSIDRLEWKALVTAICEAPADDLPRLVAADWLDEQCFAERAEFIRIQVELSKIDLPDLDLWDVRLPDTPDWILRAKQLHRRAWELQGPHSQDYFGENYFRWFVDNDEGRKLRFANIGYPTIRRGFVSAVQMHVPDWLVNGRSFVHSFPVESVKLTDRVPLVLEKGSRWEGTVDWTLHPSYLPMPIFELLTGEYAVEGRLKLYESADFAKLALSIAALSWAHGGLKAMQG